MKKSKSTSVIDHRGFRLNVAIVICNNEGKVLWAKRNRQTGKQFPQGGLEQGENVEEAMYRELKEEVGLERDDVEILGVTRSWHSYKLPKRYLRHHSKPLCLGQKQRWFILKLISDEKKINFKQAARPEFDSYEWVDFSHPHKHVVNFKRKVYKYAMKELESVWKQHYSL